MGNYSPSRAGDTSRRPAHETETEVQHFSLLTSARLRPPSPAQGWALSAGYHDAYYGKAQRVRTLVARDFQHAFARV
ncbi:MAG: hypothetical protein L0338_21700, partial [Acidobacteria bacterium]|nr:hypothetical protein [Acidobacteriota bacterium]